MNKQELIEKIKALKPYEPDLYEYDSEELKRFEEGFSDAKIYAELAVKELDEPEKPVIPKYVADWIEWCKTNDVTLLGAISPIDELGSAICNDKRVKSLAASRWAQRNQETFAKAWLYGYEVDKDKLYTVEIPNPDYPDKGKFVLCKNKSGKVFMKWTCLDDWEFLEEFQLTEEEVKEKFEWAWQFREEV